MKRKEFDPLAYIESAFLDQRAEAADAISLEKDDLDVAVPTIGEYLNGAAPSQERPSATPKSPRYRKTDMRAPRPRRAAKTQRTTLDPTLQAVWESLPRNIEFLISHFDDTVAENYYQGNFKETREELIRRILDPELTLEETCRLLGVCPATVRRYTNRGWLSHHRTQGGQRRFRLSDIVRFVELHGRFPEV